ncbi:Pentatricopeptide repeat-containing protein [Seminavis robusta]|uniref:Pentatricopeptide repeat-containing protein n=1 Tax=Seminavis robusta TaxID=568900 RepID=A0A9N8DTK5_9STRA|nr:Pentatricopeptide repeat-containing protein [Seminavis robusta]|eukprot:Sro361_g126390.1 Pentatricopeptide repeat-containing protein (1065) ;mRNA; f:3654-7181
MARGSRKQQIIGRTCLLPILVAILCPTAQALVGRPAQHHLSTHHYFGTSGQRYHHYSHLISNDARRRRNAFGVVLQAEREVEYLNSESEGLEQNNNNDEDGGKEEDEEDEEEMISSGEDYGKQSLLEIYARDRKWLEKATDMILDHPLGELTPDDIDNMTTLMAAWVHRRSAEGAIAVERLLKRVVDDMRADNPQIQVNPRMYELAMDAWARSGASGSAERAQQIHDIMAQTYADTGDPTMRPTTNTYNILIAAHGKRGDGLDQAETILQEMIHSGTNTSCFPDTFTFNTLLGAYARSNDTQRAMERAPELMELMQELDIPQNAYTFTALQNVYATSGHSDSAVKALQVLQTMLSMYGEGNVLAKPSIANYNAVLTALSRSHHSKQSAEMAAAILEKMESEWDVRPDRMSYALTILACVRCREDYGIEKAEELLLKMEARAEEDERKRQEVSSAAPPSVVLDAECFNVILTALSKSAAPNATERSIAIMERMKQHAAAGHDGIMPTIRSWNALLNTISRSKADNAGHKAEQIVKHMLESYKNGMPNVQPNAYSFTAVLHGFQRSRDRNAVHRADEVLRWMERLYEDKEIQDPPDVFHYTIVCNLWYRSNLPESPKRVMQILGHMTQRAKQGFPEAKPNVKTYRTILQCLAKSGRPGEAEGLLDSLIRLEERGDERYLDEYTFNSLISALCRSKTKGGGKRAEAILERMLDYSEDRPDCKPDIRSFTNIILHYKISTLPDAPYKAEYLLNRMVSLFKSGYFPDSQPDNFAFETTMNAYSSAKHKDSGITAERMLKQMKDLRENYGLSNNLLIDGSIMRAVLFAWSVSGDEDAGRRAEYHLDYMERKYAAGQRDLKPDTRCYRLVLNAWAKSDSFEKARRALGVLKRMEDQMAKGNDAVHPNVVCHSCVINSCAFTKSSEEVETEAFRIAVTVLDKMLASKDCQPSSLTYGWFIQACGRLRASQDLKEEQVTRAWKLCCEKGLVDGFVIQRMTGATSERLYRELLGPVLEKLDSVNPNATTKEELKHLVTISSLPSEWTRNCNQDDEREKHFPWLSNRLSNRTTNF